MKCRLLSACMFTRVLIKFFLQRISVAIKKKKGAMSIRKLSE